MNNISLVLFFLILFNTVNGQSVLNCPNPYGLNKNSTSNIMVGAGVGVTMLNGDKDNASAFGIGSYLNLDYRINNSFYVGLRGQLGSLKMIATPMNDLSMNSNYTSFGAGFLLYPALAFKLGQHASIRSSVGTKLLESIYIGADIMYLTNNIKDIYRGYGGVQDNAAYGPVDSYELNGDPIFKEKVSGYIFPSLNIGFAPRINGYKNNNVENKVLRLVFNAQLNFANNDELDGYMPIDGNNQRVGLDNDFYYLFSLGFRYSF